MSVRGRSPSPRSSRNVQDADVDMDAAKDPRDAKVIIVTNLTRNVAESHLKTVFGFYGEILKVDLPVYVKCKSSKFLFLIHLLTGVVAAQNRGKAALEFAEASQAQTAASHMNGGQLDGVELKVELSDLPIRARGRSRSRSRSPKMARIGPPPRRRRSFSRSRSRSPLRSRSRSPRYGGGARRANGNGPPRENGYRNRYPDTNTSRTFDRRGPPPRGAPRISRSRSRSPIRRGERARLPRRRSPSYERGGYGRGAVRGRSRSRSIDSLRSSRSRSRSPSRSRSRSRSRRSYTPSSARGSRSRSRSPVRSRSGSRARRSVSKDDIRDSRSRSRSP
jgi:RNA-binding protein with serine-rich domain 1